MPTNIHFKRQLSVISSMDPKTGGPAQAIRYLFPLFNKLDIIPEVLCLDQIEGGSIGDLNLKVISLGVRISAWQYNKNLYPWLLKNLLGYDYIIIHGLWLYQSFAVTKAIEKLQQNGNNKIPKVYVMCHGMLDPWFQKSKSRMLKSIRNWFYWKIVEHKVIQKADGVLFTCEEEMRLAQTTFSPYCPKKVHNVGYGIQEPPEFSPTMANAFYQQCSQVENKKYLLFLSRIHPKKGLDLLIKAYSLLIQDQSFKNCLPDLVIAGPNMESSYGKRIQKMVASDTDLANCIHFTGMLTGNAKWGAIYGSEAFVLPSHQENFGIAVVEAMACRKPVLISNQVNIWREIENGGGGLIGADTLDGVVRILKTWLNLSDVEKHSMGIHAFEVYNSKFLVEKAAQNIINVFLKSNE